MRRSRLGGSTVEITALSFGAAAIGNLFTEVEPERAAAAVDAAWDAGIRYFDTAPHYGLGLSERRLGEALRRRPRDAYTLSTKVGRVLDPLPPSETATSDGLSEGFAVRATHRRRWDFSAHAASAAASRTASTASASTASTSPTSTTPTTTPRPPSARRTRNWRSCAQKGSSGRSAPA